MSGTTPSSNTPPHFPAAGIELDDLLAVTHLELTPIVRAQPNRAITWAHGSDLPDPTPFLSPGNLLLTTGRQFEQHSDDPDFHRLCTDYVHALIEAGVPAIGFGTEIFEDAPPSALVKACTELGFPLVEVPYRIPFIAIAQHIAEVVNSQQNARTKWSLDAQRALSLAAVGSEGIKGVLRVLATELGGTVQLHDFDGGVTVSFSKTPLGERVSERVRLEARALMEKERRSSVNLQYGDHNAILQTLGHSHDLRGVLSVLTAEPVDSWARGVIINAVALTEMSLEQDRIRWEGTQFLHGQILELLLSGQVETARRVATILDYDLPEEPLRVAVLHVPSDRLRHYSRIVQNSMLPQEFFPTAVDDKHLILLPANRTTDLAKATTLIGGHCGVSKPLSYGQLSDGIEEARLEISSPWHESDTTISLADDRPATILSEILDERLASVAKVKLAPLLAQETGLELLKMAKIWLEHGGMWDRAARELGIHRHSLRSKIKKIEAVIDLPLDDFAGKAELWALLQAAGI